MNEMHVWFTYLFDERKDKRGYVKCFECGKLLHEDRYREISTCYSHILSKKRYPKYKGIPLNVQIVCPDCHNLYELKPRSAINQYNLKLKLLKMDKEDEHILPQNQ